MTPPLQWKVSVDPTAWVATNATLVGAVTVGPEASVWYGAVLRGDGDAIVVGPRSNLQDGCVVHADPGVAVRIGAGVSVGHRAVLHGCTIEDDVLVGMGAIVMNHVVIGAGSVVAAGALLPEGLVVPPRSLVLGMPAKVRRETNDHEVAGNRANAASYVSLAAAHRSQ
ncbi:gamma carbonic anhydrase family protein [Pedococcus sp. 5OH_020]|uniref:gamma carbonic anhydrase family protein n=1 Tax=Pedococcus sp. 5OH_020 TaxID=2989814 RepID=UPI0022E9C572|nr:gamma carbonic anhydrase family protein [Pedococcus sp. 5OH_020]